MNISGLWTPRQWVVTNASTTVPKRLSNFAIDSDVVSMTALDTTVTVTLTPDHGLVTGDLVELSGEFTPAGVIGKHKITVVSSKVFTFTLQSDPGTITYPSGSYFDLCYSFVTATMLGKNAFRTANTGTVYIGVTSVDGEQPYEILPYNSTTNAGVALLNGAGENRRVLSHWYMDVATANDGLVITMQ